MQEYLFKPAYYAHVISAIFMVIAILLLVINYKKVLRLDSIELIKILSLFAIAIAAYSQNHILLEKEYGYDAVKILYQY